MPNHSYILSFTAKHQTSKETSCLSQITSIEFNRKGAYILNCKIAPFLFQIFFLKTPASIQIHKRENSQINQRSCQCSILKASDVTVPLLLWSVRFHDFHFYMETRFPFLLPNSQLIYNEQKLPMSVETFTNLGKQLKISSKMTK